MPLLRSMFTTRSPISNVPYDVLREIFLHCLPQYPLDTMQPDTTVAPMLLCQICSSWRVVAFASPSLWSHLSCCISGQVFAAAYGCWAVRQKEIEFITWWIKNKGSMAPFLRLEINMSKPGQELSSVEDELAILPRYVTSAQYLEVDSLSWVWIRDRLQMVNGGVFPNLHTLVAHNILAIPVLTRFPPLLRRLFLYGDGLSKEAIVPKRWSALTHLSIANLDISLNFWFSLIQAVPDLQWAYFEIDGIYGARKYTKPPTKYVLPQLSTLFVNHRATKQGNGLAFPFALLLSPLHLPILRTLSLSSDARGNHPAVSDLYTVLQSTPAITTLVLRGDRSPGCLYQIDYPISLAAVGDVEPIWNHVPHLTHLQLELPNVDRCSKDDMEVMLDRFTHNIFVSNRSWLALELPGCPIQTVTLIGVMPSNPNFNTIRDFTMSSIRKRAGGALNISFNVISESEADTGEASMREWCSRKY